MDRRHAETTPRILGITGPIACGKTTVGDLLLRLGALGRIDADEVVHELEGPGNEVTRQIAAAFDNVLAPDGSVDRARLASQVFADPDALRRLEAIVHPAVRDEIRRRLDVFRESTGVVVLDAVKLLQSDLLPFVETVWLIRCKPEEQLRRLTTVRGMADIEARGRLQAQPDFAHSKVGFEIDNSGSTAELKSQVISGWKQFLGRAGSPSGETSWLDPDTLL